MKIATILKAGWVITANGMEFRPARPEKPPQREVEACHDWIEENAFPRKTFNPATYSYTMKHLVERDYGMYISNGSFIRAAVDSGYSDLLHKEGLNVTFKMGLQRRIKK